MSESFSIVCRAVLLYESVQGTSYTAHITIILCSLMKISCTKRYNVQTFNYIDFEFGENVHRAESHSHVCEDLFQQIRMQTYVACYDN